MRQTAAGLMATAAVIVLLVASSRAQVPHPSDGFLRAQWHVTELSRLSGPRLEGYVYNDSSIRITDVRLHVVERDGAAHPIAEAWGWVFGDIPAGGSAYFVVPLEPVAETYDVLVVSFDAVANEAP
jgi:hypothetical protein